MWSPPVLNYCFSEHDRQKHLLLQFICKNILFSYPKNIIFIQGFCRLRAPCLAHCFHCTLHWLLSSYFPIWWLVTTFPANQINKALHPTAVRYEDSMCLNTFGSEHEAAQKDSETFTNTSSRVWPALILRLWPEVTNLLPRRWLKVNFYLRSCDRSSAR